MTRESSPGPPAVTLGETLAAKGGEGGLTIRQPAAATASSTFITIDSRAIDALGTGVATRDFSSQT